jgi:uncharacterized protein YcfL
MKRLLLAPLLLTLLVGCSGKDKTLIERRDDCADVYANVISIGEFVKKYKIAFVNKELLETKNKTQSAISVFCQYYKNGSFTF